MSDLGAGTDTGRDNELSLKRSAKVARIGDQVRSGRMSDFNVVQITDCHLGSEPNERLLGLNTDLSLHDVLAQIQRNETPDLLLVTGDISNDGGPISYARFLTIADRYFPNTPLAWLPGNHDDPDNMLVAGKHPIEHRFRSEHWHMIFLNSRIPGEEGGHLGEDELRRLERELDAHKDIPTALFLHHQPVPVGSSWVDQYVLDDADAFFAITDKYPQVTLISWGHIHQEFHAERNGVTLMATPSTCVQFVPKSDEFRLDDKMPGYRSYQFSEDGQYCSHVGRIDEKSYPVNMAATGY